MHRGGAEGGLGLRRRPPAWEPRPASPSWRGALGDLTLAELRSARDQVSVEREHWESRERSGAVRLVPVDPEALQQANPEARDHQCIICLEPILPGTTDDDSNRRRADDETEATTGSSCEQGPRALVTGANCPRTGDASGEGAAAAAAAAAVGTGTPLFLNCVCHEKCLREWAISAPISGPPLCRGSCQRALGQLTAGASAN